MFILGVNGEYGHDASACLVEDGNLVAYSEEERTTRIKHAPMALPINAIGRCLYQRGIVLDDVSYIASSTALDYGRIQSLRNHVAFSHCQFPPIVSFDHHQCHISAADHLSGFKAAVVLVIDGQGDSQSATIAYANGQSVKILNEYDVTQSLGYFYTAATYFLGMK